MTDRKPVLALIAAAAISLFTSMQSTAVRSADAPLRVGVSLGLSGAYAEIAGLQAKAYRLWAGDVNARGGILGHRVEMVIRDDHSSSADAKKIYEDFVLRDKLDFVIGPYSSAITGAIAPVTEKHGYPVLAAGAASDALWRKGYTQLFGTIPPAGRYPIGFFAIAAQAHITRLALVYADDGFSTSLAEGTKKWTAEYGLEIVYERKIVKGTANLENEARAAHASGAQAMLMAGHFNESVNMRRALTRVGWTPLAYYASIGPGLDAYGEAVGADANGTFSTTVWEAREDLNLPGTAEFLQSFVRTYGEKPSYQAAQAYAAGQILEQAILKAGSTDRAAVSAALSELDTNVLIGRYVVDRTGVQTKRFPMIIQWQKGRREIVWPPELRTAEAVVPWHP